MAELLPEGDLHGDWKVRYLCEPPAVSLLGSAKLKKIPPVVDVGVAEFKFEDRGFEV